MLSTDRLVTLLATSNPLTRHILLSTSETVAIVYHYRGGAASNVLLQYRFDRQSLLSKWRTSVYLRRLTGYRGLFSKYKVVLGSQARALPPLAVFSGRGS